MYVDDMCFYTRALFQTNLFPVTTAKVGLTQIRTRCLINERVFCLKGSVLNHIYLRCCLCHRTWPRTLCTLGMNLQQKPPHSVWLETMVYLQACCVLQQSVLLMAKCCSLVTYTGKSTQTQRPQQHLSLWLQKEPCCQYAHQQPEDKESLPGTPAHQGTLTWGVSMTNWG